MAATIYTDKAEAERIVKEKNAQRKRDNFEYVVGTAYDWDNGGAVIGYYVGMVSND
jgi:hypothetical protein